jgi:hypothetical protein
LCQEKKGVVACVAPETKNVLSGGIKDNIFCVIKSVDCNLQKMLSQALQMKKKHVKDSCKVQMVLHYKYAGVNFFHILAISYKYLCSGLDIKWNLLKVSLE